MKLSRNRLTSIGSPSVVSTYERTTVLRNFDHLHFIQPIRGQDCNVKGVMSSVERSVESRHFVVPAYASTSILQKELRWSRLKTVFECNYLSYFLSALIVFIASSSLNWSIDDCSDVCSVETSLRNRLIRPAEFGEKFESLTWKTPESSSCNL